MKVGVNGAVRDISDLKVGANGAVRAVSEAYIGVNGAVKKVWPTFPVGTVIVLDTTGYGEWECPASGQWEIEVHGGGGGGGTSHGWVIGAFTGGGGGGSGVQTTAYLTRGERLKYSIGVGGRSDEDGDSTSLEPTLSGDIIFVEGGKRGAPGNPPRSGGAGGTAFGTLATNGGDGRAYPEGVVKGGSGGKGNKNNTAQTYGNGGSGANIDADLRDNVTVKGNPGKDGAIILTYLG